VLVCSPFQGRASCCPGPWRHHGRAVWVVPSQWHHQWPLLLQAQGLRQMPLGQGMPLLLLLLLVMVMVRGKEKVMERLVGSVTGMLLGAGHMHLQGMQQQVGCQQLQI